MLFMSTRNGEPMAAPSEPAALDNGRTDVALALVWAALIVGPACLIGYAFLKSFHLAEADPLPTAQLDRAHAALMAFAIVIVVIPAIGCVVAARTKHSIQASAFGVLLAAASILDLGLYITAHRSKPPQPAPVVTQCIPISGRHGCPGG
jgi:hypothetical protein